jgi:putative ABC transport system permease protein
MGRTVWQPLLSLALAVVPASRREEVLRDLTEEAHGRARATATLWACGQAVAIGIRLRRHRHAASRAPQLNTFDALLQDLRFASRSLGRQVSWTLMAVLTLALGIGANTAVFSVVNSTLLNPLPYHDADRLVIPWRHDDKAELAVSPSPEMIDAWRANARTLDGIERYELADVTLTGVGDPTVLHSARISDTFVAFTGVRFVMGRGFAPEEVSAGGPAVVVLGEVAWRTRFGADLSILGRAITLDGEPRTVIGVLSDAIRLPAQFQSQVRRDVFLPLVPAKGQVGGSVLARLRPGVTIEAAGQELDGVVASASLGEHFGGVSFRTWLARPGDNVGFRQSLIMLSWAVAIVLLIACLNVAHLLLARGLTRERELAIRAALGASRSRLIRQLITECLLLALAGGVVGLLVGVGLLRGLVALRPARLEELELVFLDWRIGVLAAMTTVATGVGFGLLAAWRAGRSGVAETLRATGHSVTQSRSRHRVRSLLVVGEVALAAVLLVGATLLIRSVHNLQRVDLGLNAKNLYSVTVPLAPERCSPRSPNASADFCHAVARAWMERAGALPGVAGVTLAGTSPAHEAGFMFGDWETRDHPQPPRANPALTARDDVLPNYFDVLGLRLVDGAGFDDQSAARNEVVINQTMATGLWPGERAVGKQLRVRPTASVGPMEESPWLSVVGVAMDAMVQSVSLPGTRAIYYASEGGGYTLIVRTADGYDPTSDVRAISLEMNPNLAIPTVTSVVKAFDASSVAASRFTMTVLTIFAGVAVALCAVGLYGVISYLVSQRTREIGIRLALGGTHIHIARMVLMRAVGLTVLGLVIGMAASRWTASLVTSLLFGVTPFDPVAYAAGSLLLLIVAVIACLAPLARAIRVDPLVATRAE